VLDALFRLIPALLRHFVAYGELLGAETGDALRRVRRQLIGLSLALAALTISALMGCIWVIAATWDGPHRLQSIAALCIGFALLGGAGIWYAYGPTGARAPPFARLGEEWRADLAALASLHPSLSAVDPAPAVAPEASGD
jgi:uncharacterized membrane protein YqjE